VTAAYAGMTPGVDVTAAYAGMTPGVDVTAACAGMTEGCVAGRISAVNSSACLFHDPLVCQCGDWRSQGRPAFPPVIPAQAGILIRVWTL